MPCAFFRALAVIFLRLINDSFPFSSSLLRMARALALLLVLLAVLVARECVSQEEEKEEDAESCLLHFAFSSLFIA